MSRIFCKEFNTAERSAQIYQLLESKWYVVLIYAGADKWQIGPLPTCIEAEQRALSELDLK